MDTVNFNRTLTCVFFPGNVKNEDRAIECLGGIRGISQVHSQNNKKRLGLTFQPENPNVKRIFANYGPAAGVLLKVKVKKTKVNGEVKRNVISTSVVGKVDKMYRFESLCDFQYLPISYEGPNQEAECLLDKILPSGTDTPDFMLEPCPFYIVPSHYTRAEKPINYLYTDRKQDKKTKNDDDEHVRCRSERSLNVVQVEFNLTDEWPNEPPESHLILQSKGARYPNFENDFATVKKMFEERPIWSQNLIRYHTKLKSYILKFILPGVAINIKNGPWRCLWIRYGYDPRKDPGARIYQTFDFRLRHVAGLQTVVATRDHAANYKRSDRVFHTRNRVTPPVEIVAENAVYLRPGMLPGQRQIFYQYCDVQIPEVQEIIMAEPPPGYLCHQQWGWLPPNVNQICRDHVYQHVKQALLDLHNTDLKFELQQGSSDGESNSEEEGNSSAVVPMETD